MATGRLGIADLAATTITDVYTVPASTVATFTVNVCNRSAAAVTVRLALSDTTATMGDDEYIEYDVSIPANGVLERTGLVLDAGKILTAYSSAVGVTVIVYGIEKGV